MPRRRLNPVTTYYILSGGYTLFFALFSSVNLLFQTRQANLNAFQLGLVGAVLEAAILLGELPTGVVADVYGRRRSIIIGLILVGAGWMLTGAYAELETILAASIIWGLGFTFISGAQQAWIADEIGVARVGHVYLRGMQVENIGQVLGLVIGIYIATYDLNLPLVIGGACVIGLAVFLTLMMGEEGFTKGQGMRALGTRSQLLNTFSEGGKLVRATPLLMTLFVIVFFYGMASEGFDRLWIKHFYDNLGFPTMWTSNPLIWFGVVRIGAAVLGIGALEFTRRRVNTASHKSVSQFLFAINVLQMAGICTLAAAGGFTVGMIAFWGTVTLSRMWDPLYLAWINQNIESPVRATVISMSSQMNSAGQIPGGPLLGGIGSLVSLRWALYGSAVALMPALMLFTRAFGQGTPDEGDDLPAGTAGV